MSNYTVPNIFATQNGGVPASQLDANFAACLTGINNAFLSGTEAAKPAAATDGRYYFATDSGTLWRDNGTSWIAMTPGYSIGTWTPTIGGTATYTGQFGTWTKIGRLIHVSCGLQILALGTGSRAVISGLPVPMLAGAGTTICPVAWFSGAVAAVYLCGLLPAGSAQLTLYGTTAASGTLTVQNMMGSNGTIYFQITYPWA